jgi:cytochrome c oxidase assembly protein subunit 15
MASSLPGLRRAASKLSTDFFICHQYLNIARRTPLPSRLQLPIKSNISRAIRFNSSAAAFPDPGKFGKATPLSSLGKKLGKHGEKQYEKRIARESAEETAKNKFFPDTTSKSVAYWLLGSAASVFGIVVFGGLTRLTESGYDIPSMTTTIANCIKV